MESEIYNELLRSYQNEINKHCDKKSLQYMCFKNWIKSFDLTKASVQRMNIPPTIKLIIRQYSEFLVCGYCSKITWDFHDRILHIREKHMEEIYSIISGLHKN